MLVKLRRLDRLLLIELARQLEHEPDHRQILSSLRHRDISKASAVGEGAWVIAALHAVVAQADTNVGGDAKPSHAAE